MSTQGKMMNEYVDLLDSKARSSEHMAKIYQETPLIADFYEDDAKKLREIMRLVGLMDIPKRERLSFSGDAIDRWSVKNVGDQINLMSGSQARNALHAVWRGSSSILKTAIKIGYMTNPTD